MAQQILEHKKKKDSTIKWFIIAIIPILNFYFLWKAAENISGHDVTIRKYESLNHMMPKEDTIKWFAIFFVPAILGLLAGFSFLPGVYNWGVVGIAGVIIAIAAVIGLYMLYKMAVVVSGHEKVYDEYEQLSHMEKKESTAKWMIFGLIPLLNLYFIWTMAEVISGHDVAYGSEEELEGTSGHEHGRAEEGERPYCPECGSEISMGVRFCSECGAEIHEEPGEEAEHEEAQEEEKESVCPECGAPVSEDAKFCPECGTEL